MRRFLLSMVFCLPILCCAQLNIGLKAGLNFANVTKASEVKADTRTGYMLGGYISPKAGKILGYRSEIILSRQGYDFKTGSSSGNVTLDYLLMPQLITLSFTKFVQLHAGGQVAFLLNAEVDSTSGSSSGSLLDYFNRFDYGLAAGAEVFPLRRGLFVGARINISLNNLSESGTRPSFIPDIDA